MPRLHHRRREFEGRIPRDVSLKPGQERLRRLGGLGGAVAAVHAGQFSSLGADGLVQAAQLFFLGGDRCFELLDGCVQGDWDRPVRRDGKTR